MRHIRLGINIDHVATLRNARGGTHPDPVLAAQAGEPKRARTASLRTFARTAGTFATTTCGGSRPSCRCR